MERELALQFVIQILRTAGLLLRESRGLFKPYGLTDAQFNVINVLATQADGVSQRELSDILVVDRSNITGLIDRMGQAGLVRREAVPGDRRVYSIRITAKGRRLWEKVNPIYEAAVIAAVKPLSVAKVKGAIEALRVFERSAPYVSHR
jgi:DNA-binding MarR family transcriptional regulator